jgi:hypothetical protein
MAYGTTYSVLDVAHAVGECHDDDSTYEAVEDEDLESRSRRLSSKWWILK